MSEDPGGRWKVMAPALEELEKSFAGLDARLKPIAKRRVDVTDPGWLDKLARGPHPLDAAGVREEARRLLRQLIDGYASADETWRAGVRGLLQKYDSLAWSLEAPGDRSSIPALRTELILFSLLDQGKDPRDAKLWLDDLRRKGRPHGEAFKSVLREVARLSSAENRYGWGSTQQWLEEAAGL